ncbi:LuxR C-terminal-related transcriptional regulator [Sphingobacterium daejeonense]|uniref:LuxR C-terminal-related transcriptional regulator n=1 Tax=Sphingobacterium daejeonense TaxID=371142 RepID=UPI0010C36540|nr:LuxR C-terminal-related transcriptional regulator [Sphingobacterium daejeonense]VTP95941.1 Bacterial regulatory proteins, luxR family [Sphingobacterium daejeonense]
MGIQEILKGNKFRCKQTQLIVDKKNSIELKSVPKLTRREKEILAVAAMGLTTNQIAEKLYLLARTQWKVHRKNLIEKFRNLQLELCY